MEINYKKVDFIKWDSQFLMFCLLVLIILWNSGEIICIVPVFIVLFIRIFFPLFVKKNTKISFLNDELAVSGKRIKKEIQYFDIKKLVIRKNILGSYDIIINPDISECMRRYHNYYYDIADGEKNGFVICDVKNIDEIEEYLLGKMNFYRENNLIKEETVYSKYSIFMEYGYLAFFVIGVPWLIMSSLIISSENPLIYILILIGYIILINIKFLKKKYTILKIGNNRLSVKIKNKRMYVVDDFDIQKDKMIVKYKYQKGNMWLYNADVLPSEYYFEKEKDTVNTKK